MDSTLSLKRIPLLFSRCCWLWYVFHAVFSVAAPPVFLENRRQPFRYRSKRDERISARGRAKVSYRIFPLATRPYLQGTYSYVLFPPTFVGVSTDSE